MAAPPQEDKARQLFEKGQKNAKASTGFFGSLTGGQQKLEDAVEAFVSAGNMYKIVKKCTRRAHTGAAAPCRRADVRGMHRGRGW